MEDSKLEERQDLGQDLGLDHNGQGLGQELREGREQEEKRMDELDRTRNHPMKQKRLHCFNVRSHNIRLQHRHSYACCIPFTYTSPLYQSILHRACLPTLYYNILQWLLIIHKFYHTHMPSSLSHTQVWYADQLPWQAHRALDQDNNCLFSVIQSSTGVSPGLVHNQWMNHIKK